MEYQPRRRCDHESGLVIVGSRSISWNRRDKRHVKESKKREQCFVNKRMDRVWGKESLIHQG